MLRLNHYYFPTRRRSNKPPKPINSIKYLGIIPILPEKQLDFARLQQLSQNLKENLFSLFPNLIILNALNVSNILYTYFIIFGLFSPIL